MRFARQLPIPASSYFTVCQLYFTEFAVFYTFNFLYQHERTATSVIVLYSFSILLHLLCDEGFYLLIKFFFNFVEVAVYLILGRIFRSSIFSLTGSSNSSLMLTPASRAFLPL